MLEKVDLDLSLSKSEFKERLKLAGEKLTLSQRACWEAGIPIVILFEGWDASGKGTSINFLTQYMDPRGFRIHPIKGATSLEKQMPWMWRFWLRTPNYGEVGIFDRSWYGRILVERVEGLVEEKIWRDAYQDIVDFEHTLAEDGYLIIKFFMHISKKEQKKRFKKLESDPLESWRVTKEDWNHHKKYDDYVLAIEEMLARTDTEWGSWVIVEATDRYWSHLKVMEFVSRRMGEALIARGKPVPVVAEKPEVSDEKDQGEVQ
jgi:polyphosphate kinase 2 (PPK2 family)